MTKQQIYEARLASLLQRAQAFKEFTAKAVEDAQKGLEELEKLTSKSKEQETVIKNLPTQLPESL